MWGQWLDTVAPEFPPVSPHYRASYRAEGEPGEEQEEEVQKEQKSIEIREKEAQAEWLGGKIESVKLFV